MVTAPASAAATAAANLAAQGYIITAIGRADDDGDVLLVGTRVQGDTLARPFIAAQGTQAPTMWQQGYSTVGAIEQSDPGETITYLGER